MDGFQPIVYFLILVALVGLIAIVVTNRFAAKKIAQEAEARGWRYILPNMITLSRPTISLAGQTTNKAVWELRRINEEGQFQYSWRTYSAPLPYGSIRIVPENVSPSFVGQKIKLRAVKLSANSWPAEFSFFTSHDQLATLLFDETWINRLRQFPPYPQNGSIKSLSWEADVLVIICLYREGWETIDDMVALGEELLKRPN